MLEWWWRKLNCAANGHRRTEYQFLQRNFVFIACDCGRIAYFDEERKDHE